jgi:4-methylaminobutanoate oxidase (formaldehyde-forming)
VIVGAGIVGASIAYHLAKLGQRDVVVVEQGDLASGTTSHAPGLVGQLRSSVSLTKMLMYSVSLYRDLTVNGNPGYQEVGSLRLASSKERLEELKRQAAFALGIGLEAHLVSPREVAELFPLMSLDAVEGALFFPHDGSAQAPILARAMIDDAGSQGVSFCPHTRVEAIEVFSGRVRSVQTTAGRIETEILVIAAGVWSPLVGRMSGVSLPLTPMQHQYVTTGSILELKDRRVPNLRDPDNLVYLRQDGDSLKLGGYEHDPAPYGVEEIPQRPNPTTLAFDPARFDPLWRAAVERVPALGSSALTGEVNGLESFTPDGEFLLGPASEVKGIWAACGFCAHGVSGAGGVGRLMAEWIVEGEPSLDLWHMDLRRFGAYGMSSRYVRQRAREIYSSYYAVSYPGRERSSARKLRLSPLYEQLNRLGAVFGEKAAWERPNWFTTNEDRVSAMHVPRGWPSRYWSSAIAAEHEATRERAALFDVTSFSKLEVAGPGALAVLQRLAANEMDKPVGSLTYTQLLNERGGVECDLTVTRLAPDRFQLITGTAFGAHDLSWIRQHLPSDGSVYAQDVTSSRCCVGLWGPRAREILQQVSNDDLSNRAFPYLTARHIAVGDVPVLALRVTYVGELGWELYAPMEYGHALWETLWQAGQEYGVVPAGYRAIDSLRLEKGYRYWSADIHSEYNPYEAGLGFAVRLGKGDFIGRSALLEIKQRGLQRKLCCMVLADPTAVVLGDEPCMAGNRVVGRMTSGGYGYTVKQSIAYGYLPVAYATPGTDLEVLWFGERVPLVVTREPLYDPANQRVKEVSAAALKR